MKLAILIIIIALGLMMPLYWIIASLTSVVSFFSHKVGAIRKGKNVALNPHLGLTMADGGDPVNEKQHAKKIAAIKLATKSEERRKDK